MGTRRMNSEICEFVLIVLVILCYKIVCLPNFDHKLRQSHRELAIRNGYLMWYCLVVPLVLTHTFKSPWQYWRFGFEFLYWGLASGLCLTRRNDKRGKEWRKKKERKWVKKKVNHIFIIWLNVKVIFFSSLLLSSLLSSYFFKLKIA